jgi:ribonuclease HII
MTALPLAPPPRLQDGNRVPKGLQSSDVDEGAAEEEGAAGADSEGSNMQQQQQQQQHQHQHQQQRAGKASGSSSSASTSGTVALTRPRPAPAEAVVKGDGSVMCIAAASVIAKVTRDREMERLDGDYPVYGFARHKVCGPRALQGGTNEAWAGSVVHGWALRMGGATEGRHGG